MEEKMNFNWLYRSIPGANDFELRPLKNGAIGLKFNYQLACKFFGRDLIDHRYSANACFDISLLENSRIAIKLSEKSGFDFQQRTTNYLSYTFLRNHRLHNLLADRIGVYRLVENKDDIFIFE